MRYIWQNTIEIQGQQGIGAANTFGRVAQVSK